MSRFVLGLFVCASALALPLERARAWSCSSLGCPAWCEAPTYRIGHLSDDLEALAPGTTLEETQRAMSDWTLVSCTDLQSTYGGRTSSAPVSGDGESVVGFVESGWAYDHNVIGITTQVLEAACIVESDVAMNGQNFDFVTRPGFSTEINAYSAVLHEGGHFYGLGHSQYSTTAMYFRYGTGILEIKYDDEQGLCRLYPGADPPPDCATTGCPSGQQCSNGLCVDAPKPDCQTDFDCISVQRCNTSTGRCENKPVTGTNLGTSCGSDADCQSGLCLPTPEGSVCSQTCEAHDPHSCPTGFYCSGQAISDCAIGVCLAGAMGTGAFQTPCEKPTDCASLFCGNGRCSVPCDRGVATSCPNGGYVCHSSEAGVCGVCGDPYEVGHACDDSDDCDSGLCFDPDLDGRGVCTEPCTSDASCPDGFLCLDVGEESVCATVGRVKGGGCSVALGGSPGSGWLAWIGVTLCLGRATKRRCRPRP